MKRGYDSDPAWSRTSASANARKKRKMVSRASLRLLSSLIRKKRAADKKGKEKTICVTRTVEFPATQTIGDEKNKLLFILAIGLVPNVEKKCKALPSVKIERLDPAVEAKAKARTKEVVTEIFMRRQTEQLNRKRLELQYHQFQSALCKPTYRPSYPTPPPEDEEDNDNVEIVDLVSDEEDEADSDANDSEMDSSEDTPSGVYHHGVRRTPNCHQLASMRNTTGHFKIITSSPRARKPVFKPLGNNQESGIFRNWKPESMTRLLNMKESETEKSCVTSLKGSQSKFISSLKSIPSQSTLTVRKFSTSISSGGSCKSHVHGTREDESSSSGVSDLDYGPDAIITID